MSNVISFLEALGRDPAMARLEGEEYVAAVDALSLDDAPRMALIHRDSGSLSDLLGGRSKVLCALMPADDDDRKDDQTDDQTDDEEQPSTPDEPKESVSRSGRH